MPYYNVWRKRYFQRPYTRRYWKRKQRKPRFRFRYRRVRAPFQRRWRTRVRRHKFFIKKKKKWLPIRQWQPELIRRCKVKGNFTIISGNYETLANNYAQYRDSQVPEHFPSGGGWGIFVFNLGCLFDEFLRVRNWWTSTNVHLPLVRYLKCKLTFYRHPKADYVVYYTRNLPMTDDEYQHADACPNRMLMKHKKILVTSLSRKHRKPYVRKTIRPPKLLMNKWFFQRDFANQNLIMLTATLCSLDNYSRPPNSLSNTIYLKTFNPKIFHSLNFNRTNTTEPYHPKPSYYFWATNANINISDPNPLQNVTFSQCIFLGQAQAMRVGQFITEQNKNTYTTNSDYWGNIFCKEFLTKDYTILVCNVQPGALGTTLQPSGKIPTDKFTIMTEPIFNTVAYNPELDTGKDTSIYFLPNFSNNADWTPPRNEQLIFSGFPLWMLLWGWPDWQKKLALINQIDDHYILVVNSPYFVPNLKSYIFIDDNFIENYPVHFDPHPDHTEDTFKPLLSDQLSWHPKFKYQKQSINLLCSTCPGSYKFSINESVNINMNYIFYFKWGGSPSTLETIANPDKQPKYPTPGNITTGLQIQDPLTDPASLIYNFDIRRDELTKKAVRRITSHDIADQPIELFTEPKYNPRPPPKTEKDLLQLLIEKTSQQKEAEERIQLFRHIREKQHNLHLKLIHLLTSNIK
nr:MAG: ORF1 [TTV-like mini virus]